MNDIDIAVEIAETRKDVSFIRELLEDHVAASCAENGCALNDRVVRIEQLVKASKWLLTAIIGGGGLFGWLKIKGVT